MRIILLSDVRGLGKKMEIKEVSEGHARNFLIPRGLAKIATAPEIKKAEDHFRAKEKQKEGKLNEIKSMISSLKNETLTFSVKTDTKGSVFGSVNRDSILSALRAKKILGSIRAEVDLAHPIKEIGEHSVEVRLPHGLVAQVKVKLQPQ